MMIWEEIEMSSRKDQGLGEARIPDPLGPIVSSAHLAAGASPSLSEFEF